jgi:hypothetical protein
MRVRGAHLLCKRSSLTPAFAPLVRSEDVEVFSFGDCRFAFMEASARRGFKLEGFLFDFRLWALAEGETRPDGGGPQAPQGAGCSALISGAGALCTTAAGPVVRCDPCLACGDRPAAQCLRSEQNGRASKGRRSSGVSPMVGAWWLSRRPSALIPRLLDALRMRRLHLLI